MSVLALPSTPTTTSPGRSPLFAAGPSGTGVTMTTQGSASGACTYSGTLVPNGQLANVTGSYSCADGRSGTFTMADVNVAQSGFTARFSGNRITSTAFGRMAGNPNLATYVPGRLALTSQA